MHDVLLDLRDTGQRWHRLRSPPIDSNLRTVLLELSGHAVMTQCGSFQSRALPVIGSLPWFGLSTNTLRFMAEPMLKLS